MESVRRRGVLMAYLAAVSHCGGDANQFAFPDGEGSDAIVTVSLATLAFVLSKVRVTCGVGCLVLCELMAVRDARGRCSCDVADWHSSFQLACIADVRCPGCILTVRMVGRAVLHRWSLLSAACYLLPLDRFVLVLAACRPFALVVVVLLLVAR